MGQLSREVERGTRLDPVKCAPVSRVDTKHHDIENKFGGNCRFKKMNKSTSPFVMRRQLCRQPEHYIDAGIPHYQFQGFSTHMPELTIGPCKLIHIWDLSIVQKHRNQSSADRTLGTTQQLERGCWITFSETVCRTRPTSDSDSSRQSQVSQLSAPIKGRVRLKQESCTPIRNKNKPI